MALQQKPNATNVQYTPGNITGVNNVQDALDAIGTSNHAAAVVTNNAAPFSFVAGTQTLNVPQTPTLQLLPATNGFNFVAGDGGTTITYNGTQNTSSGIQGNGTTASPIKENFDNLPAAATLPNGVTFVVANDGANNDGAKASLSQVRDALLPASVTADCSATPQVLAWASNNAYRKIRPSLRLLETSTSGTYRVGEYDMIVATAASITVTLTTANACDTSQTILKNGSSGAVSVVGDFDNGTGVTLTLSPANNPFGGATLGEAVTVTQGSSTIWVH